MSEGKGNPQKEDGGEYSKEEKRIIDIAQQSYIKALQYHYFPCLPDPNFIFDYTKEIGFFIDPETWRITLNLANHPNIYLEEELYKYFLILSIHEISHYTYIPYDNLTNMKLLAAVIQTKMYKMYAPMVVNIFSDLLIDDRIHSDETYEEIIEWELKLSVEEQLRKRKIDEASPLWNVLVACYEYLWNIKSFPFKEERKIYINMAEKVCKIIQKDMDNETLWESKVKKIARLLKEILKKSCSLKSENKDGNAGRGRGGKDSQNQNEKRMEEITEGEWGKRRRGEDPSEREKGGGSSSSKGRSSNPFQLPDDVLETFGDYTQINNPNIIKSGGTKSKGSEIDFESDISYTAEQIASEIDLRTFSDIMTLYGQCDTLNNIKTWYRGIAKGILQIHIFKKKPRSAIPIYPKVWRIGDPIEELDVVQTLLASPLVIPNITTRKWEKFEGVGLTLVKGLPDLMIVIDSSGSMEWEILKTKVRGEYHVALLAAFAAMQYAIEKGAYISAINFSNRIKKIEWTNKQEKVEGVLLDYQGMGTVMPTKAIEDLAKKADGPSIILIISDLGLANWKPTKNTFLRLIDQDHKVLGFFIGGSPKTLESKDFQELINRGARFHIINEMKDLVGLVISEVQEMYDPNEKETR